MKNDNGIQNSPNPCEEAPVMVKTIGKTTYYVRIHFSITSHKTIQY